MKQVMGIPNIRIVYDNQERYGFLHGWGFSALINDSLLFDMGENPESIRTNLNSYGISLKQIKEVALSHEDWDHIGGLDLLSEMPSVEYIYIPAAFSAQTRDRIIELRSGVNIIDVGKKPVKMQSGNFMTPQLSGGIKKRKTEISLAIILTDGIALVTGCAHPGLTRILRQAEKFGKVKAVIGGFHGFRKISALNNVKLIVPTHCTRRKNAILARYPMQAHPGAAGAQFDLSKL